MLDAFLEQSRSGGKSLADFGQKDLQEYIDRRMKGGVKASTVRRELNPLRHVYKVARRERGIPVPDIFQALYIPPDPPARERRLTRDERHALFEATTKCRGKRQYRLWFSLILAAYCTALRRGELLKLLWADIDFDKRTLLVRAESSKTRRARLLPLERMLCWHLMLYRSLVPEEDKTPSSRVFPISGTAHEQAWKRIVKRAGIEDLHFHDLRHAGATRYDELGLTRSENEYMLGHSGSGTNSKYVHAEMERIRAKLDVGQEDIDLPTNDEQLRREYDSLECIPDELDEIMCAWREKRDINKLSQTEKETIATTYAQNPKFRYFVLRYCTNIGEDKLQDLAAVSTIDRLMSALRPPSNSTSPQVAPRG